MILRVKQNLKLKLYKFTLRISYPEAHFLHNPTENMHGTVIKREISNKFWF